MMIGGIQIVETVHATEPAEDWSRVRSPARAKRRMNRGFPQNVVYYRKPAGFMSGHTLYAHPEFVRELKAHIDAGVVPAPKPEPKHEPPQMPDFSMIYPLFGRRSIIDWDRNAT